MEIQREKITIQDIADRANVSKSTVSRVINDTTPVNPEKRRAVLEAMKELDFQPNSLARSLAGGRSMTVGIVTQNIGTPFYDLVAQGIVQQLVDTNYSPIFADGRWNRSIEEKAVQTLISRQVDGLIIVGGYLTEKTLNDLKNLKPTILVARQFEGWDHQCICINNKKAAYEATQHLIEHGHKRIAFIKGKDEHTDAGLRLEGYEQALEGAGIAVDPQLICEGDFTGESGSRAVAQLCDQNVHFTAIFGANDTMIYGARLELHRRNLKVPEQVSLVGFDDLPTSEYCIPPLTTVAQPTIRMGKVAAQALLNLLSDQKNNFEQPNATLVKRDSVAKIS